MVQIGPNAALRARFPTTAYLREHARRHAPRFAFEYADGGAGSDRGIEKNWAALDAIELIPRYGRLTELPPIDVQIFGRHYAAPVGVAPMGGPAIVFPGADMLLAAAAQRARIPYVLGIVGTATIEQVAQIAPDVFWCQIYPFARDDHRIGYDLLQRADAAGAHAMVLTVDSPARTPRPREIAVGLDLSRQFRPSTRMLWDILCSPSWAWAMLKYGHPKFASLKQYVGKRASTNEVISFARHELNGIFSWDVMAQYRDRWKGPAVIKGVLHPGDAEKALSLGFDGVIVSNHGGRQVEALPAPIDCLPAIVKAVGHRMTVMMDSGIRSGTDVVRALVLGASVAFAGKTFLWGLAALGRHGPDHVIDLLVDETRATLGQFGIARPSEAPSVVFRHARALDFAPDAVGGKRD